MPLPLPFLSEFSSIHCTLGSPLSRPRRYGTMASLCLREKCHKPLFTLLVYNQEIRSMAHWQFYKIVTGGLSPYVTHLDH